MLKYTVFGLGVYWGLLASLQVVKTLSAEQVFMCSTTTLLIIVVVKRISMASMWRMAQALLPGRHRFRSS